MYGRSAEPMSMNSSPLGSIRQDPVLKTVIWGFLAGLLGGVTMLFTMALLRLVLGWPTPTELIFDRLFPLLTVEFFIGSLVKAGGYTPLKLQGIYRRADWSVGGGGDQWRDLWTLSKAKRSRRRTGRASSVR